MPRGVCFRTYFCLNRDIFHLLWNVFLLNILSFSYLDQGISVIVCLDLLFSGIFIILCCYWLLCIYFFRMKPHVFVCIRGIVNILGSIMSIS
jgi:hypothetical protein